MKHHPEIEQLLTSLHVSPLKRYGQNFLVDQTIIHQIISAAKIEKHDQVIEIGPGLGAITKHLPLSSTTFTSFEIDQTFHRYLQTTYPQGTHHRQNFLKASAQPVDIVLGNLPYYITTELIEKVYKDFPHFKRAVLMVQKEVIPRLIAKPKDDAYGPLAIFLATLGTISIVTDVQPTSFYPEPHVQSTIFVIERFPGGPRVETKDFFYFIKKLFLHRRKTILNNYESMIQDRSLASKRLAQANIEPTARPETIEVDAYLRLFALEHSK
ncbi:MAG: 16S rRNA (adenine(1518)-N(6)/adenine(1519)-N(6))-dimethyltransferase RsmA [Bacilli bacterium]